MSTHHGWISGDENERTALEALGFKLGAYAESHGVFTDCAVDDEVLHILEAMVGKRFWSLGLNRIEQLRQRLPDVAAIRADYEKSLADHAAHVERERVRLEREATVAATVEAEATERDSGHDLALKE